MLFVCTNPAFSYYGHVLEFVSLVKDGQLLVRNLHESLELRSVKAASLAPFDGVVAVDDMLSCANQLPQDVTQAFKNWADKRPLVKFLGYESKGRGLVVRARDGGEGAAIAHITQYIDKGWLIPTSLCLSSIKRNIAAYEAWEPKVGDLVMPFMESAGWASFEKGSSSKVIKTDGERLVLEWNDYGWNVEKRAVFPCLTKGVGVLPTKQPTPPTFKVGDAVRIKEGCEVYRKNDVLNPIDISGVVIKVSTKGAWGITVDFGGIKNCYKEGYLEKV